MFYYVGASDDRISSELLRRSNDFIHADIWNWCFFCHSRYRKGVALMDAICLEPEKSATVFESRVLFEELEDHHCRFAFGEELPYAFCGKDRFKHSSYCLQHSLMCEVVR